MIFKKTMQIAGIMFLCAWVQLAQAQVAVIVSPKSPIASMTAEQVSSVFLGKSNTLPSGATAVPIDLPDANGARDQFYAKVAGKTGAQVKATWARLTFSGKATPPRELANVSEVKKAVAGNPDAIGYIDKASLDSSVKAVLVVE